MTTLNQFILPAHRKAAEGDVSIDEFYDEDEDAIDTEEDDYDEGFNEGFEGGFMAGANTAGRELDMSDIDNMDADELMELTAALQEDVEERQAMQKMAELVSAQADFYGRRMANAFYDELKHLKEAHEKGHLKQAMDSTPEAAFIKSLRELV